MGGYNRNNRSNDRGYRGGGGDYRGRDSGSREMHKAVCAKCGNSCEIPFRPSGDRPVYCSSCFEGKDNGSSERSSRRSPRGSDFGERDNTHKQIFEQFNSLNTKLDQILEAIKSASDKKPASKKAVVKKTVKKAS